MRVPVILMLMVIELAVLIQGHLNSLNGKQIQVIWTRWDGNPKGLSGTATGGEILNYLSARFNFTYEMVRVTENRLEPIRNEKGLFNYLWDKQCDLLIYTVVPTSSRLAMVDLTLPFAYDSIAFLIPVPDGDEANIYAIIKPFQWPVWLLLAISAVCVIFVLHQLTKFYNISEWDHKRIESTGTATRPNTDTGKLNLYVLGNLLSQGGFWLENRLSFRLVTGVWLLGAFILGQAYISILFTYVMTPITLPLINSAADIVANPSINLLMKRDGSIESLIKSSNNTLFRKLQDKINASPNSRCSFVSECINMVKPGSKNIFVDAKSYHMEAITANFKTTGKCDMQLARDNFINGLFATFSLQKGSLYTDTVSLGLLEIQAIGLNHYWSPPIAHQCLSKMKDGNQSRKTKPAITMKNLAGAFLILLFGLSLSILAFIYEHMFNLIVMSHA